MHYGPSSSWLRHDDWGDSDKARIGDWVLAIGNPFFFLFVA